MRLRKGKQNRHFVVPREVQRQASTARKTGYTGQKKERGPLDLPT